MHSGVPLDVYDHVERLIAGVVSELDEFSASDGGRRALFLESDVRVKRGKC